MYRRIGGTTVRVISIWKLNKNAILESYIMQIFPNSIYEHYKGHHYRVITIATFSEDIDQQFVIYEALYPNPVSQIWARPISQFLESIEVNGKVLPRFKYIERVA